MRTRIVVLLVASAFLGTSALAQIVGPKRPLKGEAQLTATPEQAGPDLAERLQASLPRVTNIPAPL